LTKKEKKIKRGTEIKRGKIKRGKKKKRKKD